ncbi:MAG: helix-turn-helix domain-containing protein [Actinocatenispora sp.]
MDTTHPDTGQPDRRPLRADARRNLQRILDAAQDVFGAAGDNASTDEVARRAGVGIATVFRHFPTKQALLEAAFTARLERLRDHATALLAAPDPGTAFFDYFTHVVHDAPAKLSIAGALADAGADVHAAVRDAHDGMQTAFGHLLQRAQNTGAVRDDIHLPEVYALLIGASRAAAHARLDPETTQRTLRILFDGLRTHPTR